MKHYPTLQKLGFQFPKQRGSAYHGASTGRRSYGWKASDGGPTAILQSNLTTLRRRARHQVRNDPYGRSAMVRLVANIIGTGIRPYSKAPDEAFREALSELWEDWSQDADADGVLDFYGLQSLAVRSMLEGGECFMRIRQRRPEDGLAVPVQFQLLESEFCPVYLEEQIGNGNRIHAGIELDSLGRRVAYWMHRAHPMDNFAGALNLSDLRRVPAEQIIHLFEPLRPGQLRGEPRLSGVLLRMHTLDKFDDATLVRQEVAALFAGFITRRLGDEDEGLDPITGRAIREDEDGIPAVELEPGTLQGLEDGEDIKFSTPPDAGSTYPEFMRQQMLAIAAGLEVPYEVLTGDLSKVNDRTARIILNEFRRRIQQFQQNIVVQILCRRMWSEWMDQAVLAGELAAPGYSRRRRRYQRVNWVPQGWQYIHPLQDVQAHKMAVDEGFESRDQVIYGLGRDPAQVDEENAQGQARAREHGLVYGSEKAAAPTGEPQGREDREQTDDQ